MIESLVQSTSNVVGIGPVLATPTDFLRLLVVPAYGWTAYRDVKTRRVPNRTWIPLVVFGLVLLAADAWFAAQGRPGQLTAFALRAALSIGFVVPLSYVFWRIGGFGGADAKALMVLALLFPAAPLYLFQPPISGAIVPVLGEFPGTIPIVRNEASVFSFTVLTNGVLAGIVYPLLVTLRNVLARRIAPVMFIGRPVPVSKIPETYGRLLETPEGTTRRGLDIDALRMYLRWRGISLAEVRENPDAFRDPTSLPDDPNPPGDGAIADGGRPVDDPESTADESEVPDGDDLVDGTMFGVEDEGSADAGAGDGELVEETDAPGSPTAESVGTDHGGPDVAGAETGPTIEDDPWGAEVFLADVGSAYGTTPEDLRDGLEVLVAQDDVWVSPGLPFLVPVFLGLLVAFVYGDLLFGLLGAIGVV